MCGGRSKSMGKVLLYFLQDTQVVFRVVPDVCGELQI